MHKLDSISRLLILSGVLLILAGLIWHGSGGKIPLGKLPGDFRFESENNKIYIPLTSSLLISALLSLIAWIFKKF